MIVSVESIKDTPRNFRFLLGPEKWTPAFRGSALQGVSTPLAADIRAYRAGRKIVLEGHLTGVLRIRCDRCLEEFQKDLDLRFRLFAMRSSEAGPDDEVELTEADMAVEFFTEEELDLEAIAQEQVYLSLPIKNICREDCRGLCKICGQNLNERSCDCSEQSGHPAFSKLKDLKLQGD